VWATKRNFFIKNIYSLYKPIVPFQCIKIYIIIKQLLDDIQDLKVDSAKGEITPITTKTYFIQKEYYNTYINNLKLTNAQQKLCNVIFRFHLTFLGT